MAKTPKFLLSTLFLCLATNALRGLAAPCGTGDVGISQAQLGQNREYTVFQVTVSNRCKCTVGELLLSCPQFPVRNVNPPGILQSSDTSPNTCRFSPDEFIDGGKSVTFTYEARLRQWPLSVLSAWANC